MRFYKIFIDGILFEELSPTNPMALNVIFEFKEYSGAETPQKTITIINPPYEIFKNTDMFLDKKVEVYAGFLDAPYLQSHNIRIPKNTLIGFGYVQNVINNWNLGAESKTEIKLSPSPLKKDNNGYLLQIKKGDSIKSKIQEALQSLYSKAQITIQDNEIQAVENETIQCFNSYDLQEVARRYKAEIYTNIDGFLIANKEKLGGNVRVLQDVDFIEQPNIIGINQMVGTFMLRGDFSLGMMLSIPAKIFNTISPNSQFYTFQPKTFLSGEWLITKIWHNAESRNPSYKSWITSIEAVKKEAQ